MMKQIVILLLAGLSSVAHAVRIKDIATIQGVRDNQLVGYGVVVGLNGTGDKGLELTEKSLNMIVRSMGVPLKSSMDSKNAASVVVTATLSPFANPGSRIPIRIASIGTASSLEGGTLLMTPLKGADGQIYGMAQGSIPPKAANNARGGASASSGSGISAVIPNGAILEKSVQFDISKLREIKYQLHTPDFTTAARMAHKINEELGAHYSSAIDAGTIEVLFPIGFKGNLVELVAQIESVDIEADNRAKVVVNPATGTVILGQHVSISPVAIAHNNLRMEIEKKVEPKVKKPVAPLTDESIRQLSSNQEEPQAQEPRPAREAEPETIEHSVFVANGSASIADVADSLNALGATPQDLIAILHSLKASGALMAELEIQ